MLEEANIDETSRSDAVERSPVKQAPVHSENGALSTEDSPIKSGGARRRTKAQLKEELREKKVQKKQCELRRQRTRNHKYMSDDFTSIFTEKKNLLAGSGYVDEVRKEDVEEEVVDASDAPVVIIEDAENVVEECVEVGSSSSSDYSLRHMSRDSDDSDSSASRPGSPYSDISHDGSTVYSISSETSEASERSRSAASQPRSQRETSGQSQSPVETRKPSYTRDKYPDESPYRRLSDRESSEFSAWRSRHESPYSSGENRLYSSVKNRSDFTTDGHGYQHESPHALQHREASPVTSARLHAHGKQRRHRYCVIQLLFMVVGLWKI